MKSTPSPRLAILQARDRAVGVLFRRGPSDVVEVIRWNMGNDRFERGHWFKGRLYVRRSDLSPDGELLIYFALNRGSHALGHEYRFTWTAVSRPPWLTALALWPKGNDTWFGGGMFTSARTILLNHPPEHAAPDPEHEPTGLRVALHEKPLTGSGLYWDRLERDGWTCPEWGDVRRTAIGAETIKPQIHRRQHPSLPFSIAMHIHLEGHGSRRSFLIEGTGRAISTPNGRVDWMDWDARGRAFALAEGAVWIAEVDRSGVGPFERLIDFRPDTFERREAPESARRW